MSFDRKLLRDIIKQLSMLSQLGISLVMPTLLCMLLCSYLTSHFGIGGWVYIPGLILGLGASATTGYKFGMSVIRGSHKDKDKQPVSFNRHD